MDGYTEFTLPQVPFNVLNSYPILEVGSGNGHFLVEQGKLFPEKFFIGCDIKISRVKKTHKKILKSDLINTFIIYSRGENVLNLFSKETLGGFYMNFPDPWWKKKHHKRRFFYSKDDVNSLEEKIVPGGFISFISDHEEYFFHALKLLKGNPQLEPSIKNDYIKSNMVEFHTIFAEKWSKEGRYFFQTHFKKRTQ